MCAVTAPTLKRSLGMWAIVGLGLGYMAPVTVFDTFGIVSEETDGVVPLAYLVGLVVLLFTAVSYGAMVRAFPAAGSAYTYTREAIHPALGFLVGWASLLDYLLLPVVNAVIIRLYMEQFFPEVPGAVWVVGVAALLIGLNVVSVKATSRVNGVLLIAALAGIAAFLVLAGLQISKGMGTGTLFSLQPIWHDGVQLSAVLAGTTIVAFSFIGFDAVTMYAEEAKHPNAVPRAVMLTVLIGGAIFFAGAWFAQSAFPTLDAFEYTDDTLPELALFVGGQVFQLLFVAVAFAAAVASGLSSHASVSRLLYVMGRNGVLAPKRWFGSVSPRFRTPVFTTVLAGLVVLLAITPTLDLISSVINFGALIAFTFVNLAVIAHYAIRLGRRRTPADVVRFIVLPLLGAAGTGLLWVHLSADAMVLGAVWTGVGLVILFAVTRGFRRPVAELGIDEADSTDGPDADEASEPEVPTVPTR
ncbi:APC family permease [Agromyces mediolanus]|uniref:APC family permease n=1 Tax=Agromyces mediolanus TaxID=41986 RepID=UPI001E61CD04|nr:APC family permease [Agromyces mediolanus]MCD1570522.1 APC family permease [Agromyces mediolanus]